jgi:glycosyltransferase involved in cell wall biosynthesis
MVIVINGLSARMGGGQTYLYNLLTNMPNTIELKIILLVSVEFNLPRTNNVEIRKIDNGVKNPILRGLWERFYLPIILKRESADVLFCPGGVVSTKAPYNCKTVTMFRNMIPFDNKVRRELTTLQQKVRNFILYYIMLNSMKKSDLTIFISMHASDVINSLIQVKDFVIIPHGINDEFRLKKEKLEYNSTQDYFLYVSKFDSYKHQLEVIKGYNRLSIDLKNKYQLYLVGEFDKDLTPICENYVKDNHLEKNVVFLNAVAYLDLPKMYQNSKFNIFASSCENCPNIMLEALASGRPLICSDVEPMPEFGSDSVVYFSPYSPESIYQSMMVILENEEICNHFALKVIDQSIHFNWQASAKKTWDCLLAV